MFRSSGRGAVSDHQRHDAGLLRAHPHLALGIAGELLPAQRDVEDVDRHIRQPQKRGGEHRDAMLHGQLAKVDGPS